MTRFLVVLVFVCSAFTGFSQLEKPKSSAEIMHELKKLKVLGSVLYVAAHPDDENTRLIAWLANHGMYRTGYLSLTRGDGGQNLIGDEQGEELGMIRTQELLAARRIDGGEQFFSRAFDFGFSKSPEEAFRIWGKEKVLSDVVWIIRKFQPDVIIARFPEDGRAGHGHHSASGIMAREGYVAAADGGLYADQLGKGVSVWQAKRVLWNTFNFGSANTIDSTQFALEVGQYEPLLGKSIGELAGEARSEHKSQGFGVSRQRGNSKEFFVPILGDKPANELLDGVNTTWSRLEGGAAIGALVEEVINGYNFQNPEASVPALQSLLKKIKALPPSVWRDVKAKEVEHIILHCAGIYTEATVLKPGILANDSTDVALTIINRSAWPVQLQEVSVGAQSLAMNTQLANNRLLRKDAKMVFTNSVMETQPYWLRIPRTNGSFKVEDQQLIGMPENKPLVAKFSITISGEPLTIEQPLQYRFVDPVKAEQYHPAYITPAFLLNNEPAMVLFHKGSKDSATIQVNIGAMKKTSANGMLKIKSKSGLLSLSVKQEPAQWSGNDVRTVTVKIPNYLNGKSIVADELEVSYEPGSAFGDAAYSLARRSIEYDHIPTQTWHYAENVKVLNMDLKTAGKKIGYLPGAGDKVAAALILMGYQVTELKATDLTFANLKQYDAVMTGVRAYNIHDFLGGAYDELMKYVQNGGNLIVQYNTNNFISTLKSKIAPYPFNLGRNRVTDEQSPVNFLLPGHPVFNHPNKITQQDFEGWVQERSIYHAEGLDASQWQLPIGFTDPTESEQKGSLAIAPYGKGNFVYTGIVFFRELPAAVPGAFRLMANLIALPKH